MRFPSNWRLISAALLLLTCAWGCTGTPNGDSGLSLPSFGAPEQWEPDLAETPVPGDDNEF